MSEGKKIHITPIQDGTSLDHLMPGTALKIVEVLGPGSKRATAAMNVESRKMGRKDIIFLEGRELNPDEISKIALIGKGGTLNRIKKARIVRKSELKYPREVEGIIRCINPNCVTNSEKMMSRFHVISTEPLRAKCAYCETRMDEEEITRLIK
jgi:aspartate carbamoyltransferase regulatory subunit